MSLVISHVGSDFVTIGADRGTWTTTADGVPSQAPEVMSRSKIHQLPGVPVVIATVGAWYKGWIDKWIADHPVDPAAYLLPDIARSFVADYFAHHDPRAKARLAECGLKLPEGKLQPHTPELLAAGASVIIAGFQPNWLRDVQLWSAVYPDQEVHSLHCVVVEEKDGSVRRDEQVAIYTMGNHDSLGPFIESADGNMDREKSATFIGYLFEERERAGRTETPTPILGPFDVVRLSKDGIEWLSGNEGQVQTAEPVRDAYVAAFDAAGNLIKTSGMNNTAVSVPVISSSGITYTSSTGSASTGDSTIELYWDGTNGSVVPQVHFPSTPYGDWLTCASGNSGALTGFNASTTHYFMSRIAAATLTVEVAQQQGGATASGVDHQWLNADGYISFAVNMACSTPAVNTSGGGTSPGGGGGGTSCPSVDQIIETQRGFLKAGEVITGDSVRDPDGDWNEVVFAEDYPAQIIGVTVAGEELQVDSQHLWLNPDDGWIDTMALHLGSVLQGADKALYAVHGLRVVGEGTMRKLKVTRQRYVIGHVVGHNGVTF